MTGNPVRSLSMLPPSPSRTAATSSSSATAAIGDIGYEAAVEMLRRFEAGGFKEIPVDKTVPELIRWHDENGPPFVRYYLNTRADFVSLAPLRPQIYEDGLWQWTDHPTATAAANAIQGPQGETLADLSWIAAREISAMGQFALAKRDNESGGVNWHILALDPDAFHRIEGSAQRPGEWFAWPSRPGLTPPKAVDLVPTSKWWESNFDDWRIWPEAEVSRVFKGSTRFWESPVSPLSHVLRDIRRYMNAARALHRATASQLILASFMWFEGNRQDALELAKSISSGQHHPEFGYIAQQIALYLKAGERSLDDYRDNEQLAVVPYPFISETAPQQVDIGRLIDPELIQAKDDALRDIARGLDLPQSYIIEGPGSGQRLLNEWRLQAAAKEGVIPDARVIASAFTVEIYRPTIEAVRHKHSVPGKPVPAKNFRLWPDENQLLDADPPDARDVLEARRLGAVANSAVVEILGMEDHELEMPDGMTDYELWQLTAGQAGGQQRRRRSAAAAWYELAEGE